MSELKPCPFCGEEPEIFDFKDGRFIVECANPDCDVYPYTSIHRDRADAVAAWNQRATVYTKPTTLSQLQEDNAKLREQSERLFDKTLDLATENSKLRELCKLCEREVENAALLEECDGWKKLCVDQEVMHVMHEDALDNENAKLRELVRDMWHGAVTRMDFAERYAFIGEFVDRMRELGVTS